MDDKTKKELTEKTLDISTDAYKYANVIYAYCTREYISEDLYELAPVMKKLQMMVAGMHINLLMLAEKQKYEDGMVTESKQIL